MRTSAAGDNRIAATTRLVCEIVFNQEFILLCEELSLLYGKIGMENPEREAFYDAFYSIYCARETQHQALSV